MSENPYQVLADRGMKTQQEADELFLADQNATKGEDPNETTDSAAADPVDTGEGGGDPVNEGGESTDSATDAAAESAAQEAFYKVLGYEKDDDVVAALNELQDYRSKVSEFQAQEASIKEKAAILAKFESPYSRPIVGKIDRAMEILNVEDVSLVSKIVGVSAENAAKDPIQAIVIAKILNDPSLLQVEGITFEDLLEIEREDRGDIDMTDTTSSAYKRLKLEAGSALTKINTFQQSLDNVKGRYTFAHEEAQASAANTEKLRTTLAPKVEELMKSGSRKFDVHGHEVNVTFSKEEVSQIVNLATNYAVNQGLDINTSEGVKSLGEIVAMVAKGAALRSSTYEKALIESVRTKVTEDYIKEQSLGKPAARTTPTGGSPTKAASESDAFYKKVMKDAGHNV
jgi:hypothetical protein